MPWKTLPCAHLARRGDFPGRGGPIDLHLLLSQAVVVTTKVAAVAFPLPVEDAMCLGRCKNLRDLSVLALVAAMAGVVAAAGCTTEASDAPAGPGALAGNAGLPAVVPGASPPPAALPPAAPGALPPPQVAPPPAQLPAGENPIPCNVAQTLGSHCLECHGAATNWGAPMSLLTYEDFHAAAPLNPSRKVYEVSAERIVDVASPMPPAGAVPAGDIAVLSQWLAEGAPMGTPEDANCQVTIDYTQEQPGEQPPPAVPAEATCYEFLVHGGGTTPHTVRPNETYVEFYYDAPWTEEVAAVRWRTIYDNTALLHHWLMFAGQATGAPGTFSSGTTGSHIGQNVELVAGWAVGGNEVDIPAGIAMDMPPPSHQFLAEWHFFNAAGIPMTDQSGIEVCVVPKASVDPKRLGSLTWLGTENFNGLAGMPAGRESKFGGVCTPSRAGLAADEPITIFGFLPHMHQLGRHMTTTVLRANGTEELVFDKPFQFDRQLYYTQDPPIQVMPGDRVRATCTFFNDTLAAVPYGPSSEQEMCYQFTFAYPARALSNGVFALSGATNTCW